MERAPRAPEFFSALPLSAVALLVVNDHLLKATFHNALTGKLSDLAGCFFLPLYVSALLGLSTSWSLQARLRVGVIATLAIFVPVSVSRLAADQLCRALELVTIPLGLGAQRIASDPTDLLALPMVAFAVLYAKHQGSPCAAPSN